MRTWQCVCGNILHFDNYQCLQCGRPAGYWPHRRQLLTLEPDDGFWRSATAPEHRFRRCRNDLDFGICNWLIGEAEGDQVYCQSCLRNEIVPDLSQPPNLVYWAELEAAKRLLLDDLIALGLPLDADVHGPMLRFAFLADEGTEGSEAVLTGHTEGRITINVAEADPLRREALRLRLGEMYRTLLGHMRHESGHYYWARFAADTDWLAAFRHRFGDERADYQSALNQHYEAPREPGGDFVSRYATAHPWEDFAETWAHYLHLRSALETAAAYALISPPPDDFEALLSAWFPLTSQLNAISRALGRRDLYPFMVGKGAVAKLRFIHDSVSPFADASSHSKRGSS